MRWLTRWIATAGGLGYSPVAPGTVGSLAGVLLGFLTASQPPWIRIGLLAVIFVLGAVMSTSTERFSGVRDPSFVVIDEVWGMWAVLVACPSVLRSFGWVALAFGLFRLFDVIKPPPVKWLERAPEGWGIMLDDLGAAAYTILILRLVLVLNHVIT